MKNSKSCQDIAWACYFLLIIMVGTTIARVPFPSNRAWLVIAFTVIGGMCFQMSSIWKKLEKKDSSKL